MLLFGGAGLSNKGASLTWNSKRRGNSKSTNFLHFLVLDSCGNWGNTQFLQEASKKSKIVRSGGSQACGALGAGCFPQWQGLEESRYGVPAFETIGQSTGGGSFFVSLRAGPVMGGWIRISSNSWVLGLYLI